MERLTDARRWAGVVALATLLTAGVTYAQADNAYVQTNLVSDGAVPAAHTDPNLVNGWGVAFNPNGFVWVADNGTGRSTLYDGEGNPQQLVVTIPSLDAGPAEPTGIVFSGSDAFGVSRGGASGPARFIFATQQGTIAAWAPTVDATNAVQVADSSARGAIYTGLALAGNGTGFFLYAADFHNARVDVFDSSFQAASLPGRFVDPGIPEGFAPFGIHAIQGNVYVTYAQQDEEREDEVAGPGLGYVSVFDANGHFIRRVASRGTLNAPWGLALAPADFGRFSHRLIVGNFGDGTLEAFNLTNGRRTGHLKRRDGGFVRVEGLWGIAFGNGVQKQPTNALFFAAGPDDEEHGLYGRIEAAQPTGTAGVSTRVSEAPDALEPGAD